MTSAVVLLTAGDDQVNKVNFLSDTERGSMVWICAELDDGGEKSTFNADDDDWDNTMNCLGNIKMATINTAKESMRRKSDTK